MSPYQHFIMFQKSLCDKFIWRALTVFISRCEKLGMTLLLIEDEIQNARIAMLLLQEGIDRVRL